MDLAFIVQWLVPHTVWLQLSHFQSLCYGLYILSSLWLKDFIAFRLLVYTAVSKGEFLPRDFKHCQNTNSNSCQNAWRFQDGSSLRNETSSLVGARLKWTTSDFFQVRVLHHQILQLTTPFVPFLLPLPQPTEYLHIVTSSKSTTPSSSFLCLLTLFHIPSSSSHVL